VDPLLLVLAGAGALAAGAAVLRSFGARYRVGRLIAATQAVSVADALAMAAGGPARYVRVNGRIDSEAEFEDADHRPLVLRRTRLQLRRGGRWATIDEGTEAVPFEVREGLDGIAVDTGAIGDGLVVVPRHSVGTAGDIPDRVPPGTAPDVPARLLVELVSSVEHAAVLGVPVARPGGRAQLTAGRGRPLVLSTLEDAEAMRLLAAGGRVRMRLAAGLLAAGLTLLALGTGWAVASAFLP
jgi:hypothetical protein